MDVDFDCLLSEDSREVLVCLVVDVDRLFPADDDLVSVLRDVASRFPPPPDCLVAEPDDCLLSVLVEVLVPVPVPVDFLVSVSLEVRVGVPVDCLVPDPAEVRVPDPVEVLLRLLELETEPEDVLLPSELLTPPLRVRSA